MDMKRIEKCIKDKKYELIENPKGKSECWKLFRLVKDPENDITLFGIASCSKCGKCIATKRNGETGVKDYGTKNLSDHMKTCQSRKRPATLQTDLPFKRSPKAKEADATNLHNLLVKFVAGAHLAFSVVENVHFVEFAQELVRTGAAYGNIDVKNVLSGKKTVSTDCVKLAQQVKKKIKEAVQPAIKEETVSFTADLWTDNVVQRSYLDITFFWVEEKGFDKTCWSLNHAMYSCAHFPGKKTAKSISSALDTVLLEVGCNDKNTPVTIDKGSNIVAAAAKKVRVDCACHRLNIVISSAWETCMEEMETIKDLDSNSRNLITFVKHSAGMQAELPISLKHGGKTRPWRSLCQMLMSIQANHKPDSRLRILLRDKSKEYLLDMIDLNLVNSIVEFLSPMCIVLDMLEYAYVPTLQNVAPAYYFLRNQWCTIKDKDPTEIRNMRKEFVKRLNEKMWGSITSLHFCATFLDPSLKEFSFIEDVNDKQLLIQQAKECARDYASRAIDNLNTSYQKQPANMGSSEVGNSSNHLEIPESSKAKDPFSSYRKTNTDSSVAAQQVPVAERLPKYKAEDFELELKLYEASTGPFITPNCTCETCKDNRGTVFNPIKWWGEQKFKYPIMSTIAKRIFVIPASSAESERHFSTMGRIARKDRARLKPTTAECQVLIAEGMKKGLIN